MFQNLKFFKFFPVLLSYQNLYNEMRFILEHGETTSHLMGLFYRTIRMLENGIKPAYVFDGKPPQLKSGELAKRTERREEAQKQLTEAQQAGDQENIEKFSRRFVQFIRF